MVTPVDNACESIDGLSIQQQVQSDQVRLALLARLVVKAGVARGDGLQGVVEVAPELRQRQSVSAECASSSVGLMCAAMLFSRHNSLQAPPETDCVCRSRMIKI